MNPGLFVRYGAPLAVVAALTGGLAALPSAEPASAAEVTEIGIGYLLAGDTTLARDTLVRVLAAEPKTFRAHYGLGLVETRDENFDLAERHLKAALALQEDPEVLLSLGAVYQRKRAYTEAETTYLAVRKLVPDHPKVAYNLGYLYSGNRRLEEAHREYSTFLRLSPRSPERFKVIKRLRLIEAHMKDKKKRS